MDRSIRRALILVMTLMPAAALAVPAGQQGAGQDNQSARPATVEGSVLVGAGFPTLFKDATISGYEELEASLSVEDKGGKVNWAPFLYRPRDYVPVLSETRFQLRQKDEVTTFGVAFKYNPLAPRSSRGDRLWNEVWGGDYDTTLEDRIALVKSQLQTAKDMQVERNRRLRPEIGVIVDEIYRLEDIIDDPDRVSEHADARRQLRERNARLAVLTAEAEAIRYQSVLAAQAQQQPLPEPIDLGWSEVIGLQTLLSQLEAQADAQFAGVIRGFYERLLSSYLPTLTLAYNRSYFSTISATAADEDMDGLQDNKERYKGQSLSLTADWRMSDVGQISGLVNYQEERATAEENTPLKDAIGWGVTYSRILTILDPNYRSSKAYKESFFIPSLVIGLSAEGLHCREAENVGCADKTIRRYAFTPFLDVKVSTATQFRIGFPVKKTARTGSANDETEISIVTLVAFQLGSG